MRGFGGTYPWANSVGDDVDLKVCHFAGGGFERQDS